MARKKRLTSHEAAARQRKAKRDYARAKRTGAREIEVRVCANRRRRNRLLAGPVEKWLKHYFGTDEQNPRKRQAFERFFRPFSDDQKEAIAGFVRAAQLGQDDIVLAPRGDWKTETVKHLIIYLICKKIIRFPVIIGPNEDHAGELFNDIRAQMITPRFAADYPEIADPVLSVIKGGNPKFQTCQGELTGLVWNESEIRLADIPKVPGLWKPSEYGGVRMLYRGMDASIRGINKGGDRPDLAFADDIETEQSAVSQGPDGQIEKRRRVIDKAIAGLNSVDPITRLICGTTQNDYCLTYDLWKKWGGRRYQAVKVWPEKGDGGELAEQYRDEFVEMYEKEKAAGDKVHSGSYQFYIDHQGIIERGLVMGNPENYSRKPRDPSNPTGPKIHISAFHRVCCLIGDYGLDYVLTELQNDPPESRKPTDLGLTYVTVLTRISGLTRGTFHPDTRAVTASVDLGRYLCHYSIWGWLEGMAGQCVNHGVIEVPGLGVQSSEDHADRALMNALMGWRLQLLRNEFCEQIPTQVLIDSSDFTNVAYSFVRESADDSGMFKAVKGLTPYGNYTDIPNQRVVGKNFHGNYQAEHDIWLYRLNSDELKRLVQLGWATSTFDEAQQLNPMALSLYSAFGPENQPDTRRHLSFAKHQVAERWVTKFKAGPTKKAKKSRWDQINPNNHQFDTAYMNMAGAFMEQIWLPLDENPNSVEPEPDNSFLESGNKPGRFARPGRPFFTGRR